MPARGEGRGRRGLRRDFLARLGPRADCGQVWGLQEPSPTASEGCLRDRPRRLPGTQALLTGATGSLPLSFLRGAGAGRPVIL